MRIGVEFQHMLEEGVTVKELKEWLDENLKDSDKIWMPGEYYHWIFKITEKNDVEADS